MKPKEQKKFRKNNLKAYSKNAGLVVFLFFCLFVLFILFKALCYAANNSAIFSIKEKDIKSNIALNPGISRKIIGASLFMVDSAYIRAVLLKENPEYKEIFIFKEFPSALRIKGCKRLPFAQVKSGRFYLVDREGMVLKDLNNDQAEGMVTVEFTDKEKPLDANDIIKDARLELGFVLLEQLKKRGLTNRFPVGSINVVYPASLHFIVNVSSAQQAPPQAQAQAGEEGVKVIIGRDDFGRKLDIFEDLIKDKLKGSLAGVKYIDLRFKNGYVGMRR